MPQLIEVAFKGNRKEFFLWEEETPPPLKVGVIVEADRGEDLGTVHATGDLAGTRFEGCAHGRLALEGLDASKQVRRLATLEETRRIRELREQDETARRKAMERVKANGLVMKVSDAEWQWDRRKLTLYFTAERRVDFRNLVRDLASLFRTRIELKQIGVRDEAKRLSGVGRCGREYCSASWLPELRPVNLGVAKDQKLSLNPSQISGACGRLMCCLRYEHDYYVQARKRFPKEGKILTTSIGEEKVVANDIFNDRVTLRNVEGETRVVPLLDLRREIGFGVTADESTQDEDTLPLEITDEELISLTDTAERPAYRPGENRQRYSSVRESNGREVNGGESSGQESKVREERPVPLERRPRPRREALEPSGPRPAPPTRTVVLSSEEPGAASSSDPVIPAEPAPPAERTAGPPTAAATEALTETADEGELRVEGEGPRPPRRRRGRRGGRRGRGARGGGSATAGEPDSGHDNDSEGAE